MGNGLKDLEIGINRKPIYSLERGLGDEDFWLVERQTGKKDRFPYYFYIEESHKRFRLRHTDLSLRGLMAEIHEAYFQKLSDAKEYIVQIAQQLSGNPKLKLKLA